MVPTNDKDLAMNTHKGGGPTIVAYLLALPAIIILFIYKIIPFITALVLPFKEYDNAKGVFGSSWVGMRNFFELFDSPFFVNILSNTMILKIEYIFLCSIFTFIIAMILGFIGSKFWQRFFSTIFLLPYFIPTVVIAYLVLLVTSNAGIFFIFSTESLMDPEKFRLIYPIIEVIKNIGIPVIIALSAINAKKAEDNRGFVHTHLLPTLKTIGLFALIQLSTLLTMDYELLSYLQNPIVYETADTLDTYIFRVGLMNNEISASSAVWLIKYAIQLVLSLLIFFLIKRYFVKDIFPKKIEKDKAYKRKGSFVAVVAALFIVEVYLLFTTAPLAVSVIEVFKDSNGVSNDIMASMPLYSSFTTYIFVIALAVLINAVITLLLAYPLTVEGLPGRSIYTIFLIIVLNIGVGGIHEYLFFRDRGMQNTILPYLFIGFFTLANVFVLKAIYNARSTLEEERTVAGIKGNISSFFKSYLPRVVKPLLGLSVLQYAFMWNSCYPGQLVYLADTSRFSPVMMFRNIITGAQPDVYYHLSLDIIKLAAIISIPGIIILLLVMIFGGHEIFVSQIRKN